MSVREKVTRVYLHEAFDSWMQEEFPDIEWERYADDIIVHCVSEKQAYSHEDLKSDN